jgi:hypothetical protein
MDKREFQKWKEELDQLMDSDQWEQEFSKRQRFHEQLKARYEAGEVSHEHYMEMMEAVIAGYLERADNAGKVAEISAKILGKPIPEQDAKSLHQMRLKLRKLSGSED